MENFDNLKKTPLFEKHCALGGKIVDFGAHKAVFPEAAPYCLQSVPLNRRFHCQSSTEKPSLDPPCATAAEIGDFAEGTFAS